jgi:hypothetical protein
MHFDAVHLIVFLETSISSVSKPHINQIPYAIVSSL